MFHLRYLLPPPAKTKTKSNLKCYVSMLCKTIVFYIVASTGVYCVMWGPLRLLQKLVLIKEEKTWWEALRYCQSKHVDLVSVHTKEIQDWVDNKAKNASTDNSWIWSDGSNSSYTHWKPEEPNNNVGDNCVILRTESEYRWYDVGCQYPDQFICYEGE
ncbi:macrophage mannose receptor 1-like isoform X3 [Astyanax mexicanus]|uniref:Macrophage mannose receptor 1-like isoform X3 n=1 Tax=Astyanax mexicanus TaxID=7994 RepID=A0A8T2M0Y5_ASTMX|nr:macrophage mannose receptor 1-like isoform X3 [Astyanax mexicanus]